MFIKFHTFHVFYTLMYLTYFLSVYHFAIPKPDFLYKTASLQQGRGRGRGGGDISFHVENKF